MRLFLMKNQNLEVSCEVLFERLNNTELQETIGGSWYGFVTNYFKPKKVTPMQTYKLPGHSPTEFRAGSLPERYAIT